jgi:Uma2 family endonuclease
LNRRREAAPLPLWRLTRARYDQIVDAGIFGPEDHVELLDGLLIAREPQGERHTIVLALVRAAIERAFGRGYWIREEKPVALDDLSAPEPGLVVVRGQPRDYLGRGHPSRLLLIVEVVATPSSRRSPPPARGSASPPCCRSLD